VDIIISRLVVFSAPIHQQEKIQWTGMKKMRMQKYLLLKVLEGLVLG
jgi:hypothetical protein